MTQTAIIHDIKRKSAIAKSHYKIIWLLQQGKKIKEVAEITGYSVGWIYELV
jgi:transposase